jgi:dethiobiotin synthetase
MKPIADIIVVGTDTGLGKSVVSLLLMQLLFAQGYSPFYLKPFQTGCQDPMAVDSDARYIDAHTQALQQADPAQSVVYCHQNPKAS